ncbi:MAG: zf-HC2 domain-containing protein [Aureliella sp.]
MPLDGEKLNDLLSGFVDGELTPEERALVEEAARDDVRIGEQLKQLRQQSNWLQQAGSAIVNDPSASSRSRPNGRQLAESVISAARQRGREMGLPVSHYIYPDTLEEVGEVSHSVASAEPDTALTTSPVEVAVKSTRRRSAGWMALAGLAAAAALLIAVTWPSGEQGQLAQTSPPAVHESAATNSLDNLANETATSDSSFDESVNDAEAVGSGLVGKSSGMVFALVVDVEITADARLNLVLEKLLATSGIPLAPPIAANPEVLKALDDSRMIVRSPTATARPLSVQVVRGGMQELDTVLRKVWQDSNHFPNVALNLSIDSRATLMREILRSSGNRFTPSDRFALPLAINQTVIEQQPAIQVPTSPSQASPFPGADGGVQYISKSQRDSGWEGLGELSTGQPDSMATILLVAHHVE